MKYLIILLCISSYIVSINIDAAVKHLIDNSSAKSKGWCAKYVANALVAGGFEFQRQGSAYMYHTNGIMIKMGYKEISNPSYFIKGDITVTEKNNYHLHGHIAMYTGSQWISDFRQKSEFVYSSHQPPIHYYRYGDGTPQPTPIIDNLIFTYAVRISGGKILPEVENDSDYAGKIGTPITDIAIKVNKGSIKYRVHVKGGDWLGFVRGYDWNDPTNGYASKGKPIDLIQIIYDSEEPKYRVSPVNKKYYNWQVGNKRGNGYDGYAGALGVTIDRIQIIPSK